LLFLFNTTIPTPLLNGKFSYFLFMINRLEVLMQNLIDYHLQY